MRLLPYFLLSGLIVAAACTHGGSGAASPSPSIPPTASASLQAVCRSVASVDW